MGKRVKCMLPSKSKRPVVGGALGGRQQVEDPFRKCRFRVPGGVREKAREQTPGEPPGCLRGEGWRAFQGTGPSVAGNHSLGLSPAALGG